MSHVEAARPITRTQRLTLAAILVFALLMQGVSVMAAVPAIIGTVTDSVTGAPLAGVQVELYDFSPGAEPSVIASATTNASGTYSIASLPLGDSYVMFFDKTAYATAYEFDFAYSGTQLVKNASMVPLKPIASGTVLETGTLAPLQEAFVEASHFIAAEDYYEWAGSAEADAAGAYTVYDQFQLGAGTYELAAGHRSHRMLSRQVTWGGTSALTVNFQLDLASRVSTGTITDLDTGQPVPDAGVVAGRWDAAADEYVWTGTGVSDANGAYEVYDTMALGAGEYQLEVSAYPYRNETAYVDWDGSATLTNDFALVPPALIASGSVVATVTGVPLVDVMVDAERRDPGTGMYDWAGTAYTDATGAYAVRDEFALGAGTYQLRALLPGYVGALETRSWNGTDGLAVDFVLEPAKAIASGTVTDASSGEPIEGAGVDASRLDAVEGYYEFTGTTLTDADGSYTVRDEGGLGAGEYEFGGYASGRADVTLARPWDGDEVLSLDFELSSDAVAVPVQGDTRIETAIAASKLAFPEDGSCTTAIVASGRNFPDALGGAGLAGAFWGPVLLTEPASLPSQVAAEIERLGASQVIVVGGTSAVGANVKDAIDRLPGVATTRIFGVNRFETAADVATTIVEEMGPGYSGHVLVATGRNFPDALAGAPLAAAVGLPILLVEQNSIPAATLEALEAISPDTAIVLGGTGAVSAGVETQLRDLLGAGVVQRVQGADRYVTAANIAQWGVDNYGLSWDGVAFATGTNFPDALAGGATQGLTNSVVLLTRPTTLEAAPRTKVQDNAVEILEVRFFGGLTAISQSVRNAVMSAISAAKGV